MSTDYKYRYKDPEYCHNQYLKNREKILANQKIFRANNRETIRERDRKRYRENTKRRKEQKLAWAHKTYEEKKEERFTLVKELKGNPCVDCGRSFPPCAMDFDHVRGIKEYNVGALLIQGKKDTLLTEVAKCDLVCAVCHRIRTWNRIHGNT